MVLYTAPLTGEYSISVPLERASDFELGEGACVLASSACENISARALAPRRVSVKCRLRTRVTVLGKLPYAERVGAGTDGESIRRRYGTVRNAERVSALSEVISLSDEIAGTDAETRVVGAEAHALVEECLVGTSGAVGRGYVQLKLLCAHEDGSVDTLLRKLPFEGEVELELPASDRTYCRLRGHIGELTVSVEEGRILCDVNMALEARGGVDRRVRYVCDLYSTEYETECEYAEYEVPRILCERSGSLSQSERIPRASASVPEGARIVDAYASAIIDGYEESEGKLILLGQCKYTLICEREGEYSASETVLPLRYVCDGVEGEVRSLEGVCEAVSCRARATDSEVELSSELTIGMSVIGSERIRTLSGASLGAPVERRSGETVICYPSDGEDKWSIAKRYMADVSDIVGDPESDAYVVIER